MATSFTPDLVTGIISFVLTLMVLSYLIGDNPLFRTAIYLFIGVTAGYVASVAWKLVLLPLLVKPMVEGTWSDRLLLAIPLFLGVLLFAKLSPRASSLGNASMALLVGVTAAAAIGGAVYGTILPQTMATINLFDLSAGGNLVEKMFEGVVLLVGTVSTLAYFHFGSRWKSTSESGNRFLNWIGWLGRVFIAITLGVIFAGVYAAALTAMIERLFSLWTFVSGLF